MTGVTLNYCKLFATTYNYYYIAEQLTDRIQVIGGGPLLRQWVRKRVHYYLVRLLIHHELETLFEIDKLRNDIRHQHFAKQNAPIC